MEVPGAPLCYSVTRTTCFVNRIFLVTCDINESNLRVQGAQAMKPNTKRLFFLSLTRASSTPCPPALIITTRGLSLEGDDDCQMTSH
jgi:hypothetical protein